MATREETIITTIPDRFIRDESEKVLKKIEQKQSRLNDIANELLQLRTTGIYNYVNDIQPLDILKYIVIILVIILLSEYIPWSLRHFVGFIIGVVYIYYLNEGKRANFVDKLKTTEIHMERIIPRPRFFYQDANFIEFAYNMLSYRKYNKHAYSNMIKAMDHFLELQIDIENPALQNCKETYQVALDMQQTALNELHSLIYSTPNDDLHILETKLINATKTLQLYMQRHLDEMIEICNERADMKGWNITTNRIDKYALPGIDKIKMPNFHLF